MATGWERRRRNGLCDHLTDALERKSDYKTTARDIVLFRAIEPPNSQDLDGAESEWCFP